MVAVAMAAVMLTPGGVAAQSVLRMVIQSHPSAGQKCIDVPFSQFAAGKKLQTYDCNNTNAQIFEYDQAAQRLSIGKLCVETPGNAGDPVGLAACNGAVVQRWGITASGDYYQIVGIDNRCLGVKAPGSGNGAQLDTQACQPGNKSQLWALIQAPATPAVAAAPPAAAPPPPPAAAAPPPPAAAAPPALPNSAAATAAPARSIAGNYSVRGRNPDGSRYNGVVAVSQLGGNRYQFDWTVAGDAFTGTGMLNGNSISVDWGQDAPVIYQVGGNGVLNGTWDNGHATEVLTPAK